MSETKPLTKEETTRLHLRDAGAAAYLLYRTIVSEAMIPPERPFNADYLAGWVACKEAIQKRLLEIPIP